MSDLTPEERREALMETMNRRWSSAVDETHTLVESLLAEQAAEIERLRTAVLNGCERPCVIESEVTAIARADERRRTHGDCGSHQDCLDDTRAVLAALAGEQ